MLLAVLLLRRPPGDDREELLAAQERLERELRREISESSRGTRTELTHTLATFQQALFTQLQGVSESNALRMAEVRGTLESQLNALQAANTAKLEEMRKTVDEKLQTTLEARLGESFRQVAERLEQVHHGLGQMQSLAQGVGDLQRVLTNVKTRGMFGEVQLENLLEQV
ncbi:MAG TPA: DNA recombination protein RmuC, partial [Ramlibacter sp.]